jgi:hypothetical protein
MQNFNSILLKKYGIHGAVFEIDVFLYGAMFRPSSGADYRAQTVAIRISGTDRVKESQDPIHRKSSIKNKI